jgi:hypothetical protein
MWAVCLPVSKQVQQKLQCLSDYLGRMIHVRFLMSKQAQKYHLSLAGEFFVAAELQRRGVAAAVTYDNAKNADVVAFQH